MGFASESEFGLAELLQEFVDAMKLLCVYISVCRPVVLLLDD
jgi:hypothetical protein